MPFKMVNSINLTEINRKTIISIFNKGIKVTKTKCHKLIWQIKVKRLKYIGLISNSNKCSTFVWAPQQPIIEFLFFRLSALKRSSLLLFMLEQIIKLNTSSSIVARENKSKETN